MPGKVNRREEGPQPPEPRAVIAMRRYRDVNLRRDAGRSRFADHASFAAFAREILIVDPLVGLLEAGAERGVRFPVEILLDESIVAVAAVHALRRAEVVIALQLDSRDAFHDVHELIDGDGFGRA